MLENIILGIVQGLTEFLPVSSSGHLVLFGEWLQQTDDSILLEVLLHTGTLLATLIVFRKQVLDILLGLVKREPQAMRMSGLIIVASIPAGVIGLTLKDQLQSVFGSPFIVAGLMILTGVVLWLTRRTNVPEEGDSLNWKKALLIGCAQAFAILPGISRSGSTICTALFAGVPRKQAGEFSFLISLPAIAGATLLAVKDLFETGAGQQHLGLPMVAGVLASFLTGLLALTWLLKVVRKGQMWVFAPYVWGMALFSLWFFA